MTSPIAMDLATAMTGVAAAVGLLVLSQLALLGIVVALPADFFAASRPKAFGNRHPAVKWLLVVVKNLGGFVILLLGVVLALPGIPGPGLVLILIGAALVDFPGKRRIERKILGRPAVLSTVNRLRARFGRPPMIVDHHDLGEGNHESHESHE